MAVDALSGGDIIGMPTDTVYGLAADPFHTGAADRLFRLKGRPRRVELPVLVANEDIRHLITQGRSTEEIRKRAVTGGMRTLKEYSASLLREGLTSIDEVLRTVVLDT